MSIINSGQRGFHYLTDGDGFPTTIKERYWGYDMEYAKQFEGLRTVAQETVGSGEYYPSGVNPYAIGLDSANVNNPLYWNNARTGGMQQGVINYCPLLPQEAIKIYWLFRGWQTQLSFSALNASAFGASVTVNLATNYDAGNLFNASGYAPAERIWQKAISGTGVQYTARADKEVVWHSYKDYAGRIVNSEASAYANYEAWSYVPFNNLIRFPKAGAVADFGFESLGAFEALQSVGVGATVPAGIENRGSCTVALSLYIGSAMKFPEDDEPIADDYTTRRTVHSMERN